MIQYCRSIPVRKICQVCGSDLLNSFSFIKQEHRDNYEAVLNRLSLDAYQKLSNIQHNRSVMHALLAAGFIEDEETQIAHAEIIKLMVNNPLPAPPVPDISPERKKPDFSAFEIDATKKHYLPQFYLKGFSFNGQQLYVFDKNAPVEKAIWTSNVSRVEKSRYAYSKRVDSFITEQVEPGISRALREIRETLVCEINNRLSNRNDSHELRRWLAQMVIDFRLRSRGFRESDDMRKMYEIKDKMDKARKQATMAYTGAWLKSDLKQKGSSLEVLMSITIPDEIFERWIAITMIPFGTKDMYDEYANASMRLYEAPQGRHFICSDMPSTNLMLGAEPEYRNFQYFSIPIDKHRKLCGGVRDAAHHEFALKYLTDEHINLSNLLEFQHAHRFVYSSSMDELKRAYKEYANQMAKN